MNIPSVFLLPTFFLLLVIILFTRFRRQIQRPFVLFLLRFSLINKTYEKQIPRAFWRTIRLNWYVFLIVIGLWILLFNTEVGEDMVEVFLTKLGQLNPLLKMGSLLSIFSVSFFMSLAIWVIPFFLYSQNRRDEILGRLGESSDGQPLPMPNRSRTIEFYIATKLLVFFAVIPFMLVANSFLFFEVRIMIGGNTWVVLLANIFFLLLFLLIIKWLSRPGLDKFFDRLYKRPLLNHRNPYIAKVFRIYFWVLILILPMAFINFKQVSPSILIAIYMFLSSVAVFRILFYSHEEDNEHDKSAIQVVEAMLGQENREHSKLLYLLLFWVLIGAVMYYYFIPSLEATNTIYILLIVLSTYIIVFDFLRNLYRNRTGILRSIAFGGTVFILLIPFIKFDQQFVIELQNLKTSSGSSPDLEQVLAKRYENIISNAKDDSTVFIVCAQGGGSRAGYITARVLQKIDSLQYNLWNRTIAVSTVSGGTVGFYNYVQMKNLKGYYNDDSFFNYIYERNYNSSGVFGLLAGDAIESAFGYVAAYPRSLIPGNRTSFGFNDRNQRIRNEYDYILNAAIERDKAYLKQGYFRQSFYPLSHKLKEQIDIGFKEYHLGHIGTVPIHLINTFEINNGVRTILSPFFVRASNQIFLNARLPLQEIAFDPLIQLKDLRYRDASNLSELFPLISAASQIGLHSKAQFVDGGYYENYGISAALDVYRFLVHSMKIPPKFIKLLLIKNSPQKFEPETKGSQLLAPLKGAMSSPFTGHANHFLEEAKARMGAANVYSVEFDSDADSLKVPLTRSLTKTHIDIMSNYLKKLETSAELRNFLVHDSP